MLWLYLHFPHLLLDHIHRSSGNSSALVIVEGSGQKVMQACPAARSLGVAVGMRLKTAISLAPDLGIIRADQQYESRVLEDQARWLYRYAAYIVLVPPDGLLAEVGSLQRLYGGLQAVWQTLEDVLHERQLTAWPGLGHTPQAARLIARNGKGECTSDKDTILRVLAAMPLLAAEFDQRTRTRLQRIGLTRLGEVFSLPPAELARRFSPDALKYIQKIQGTRPDPQSPWQPPQHFRQQADFVQDIEHSQGLLFPLQRILCELENELCWRQQDTDCLLLVLQHRQTEPTRLRIRTSGPEHRASTFLNLIGLRFEQEPLQAPVVSLYLTVKRFLDREAPGGQDLLGESQDTNEAWHTLMSRLQARLGDTALVQLTTRADHRPERAWSTTGVRRTHSGNARVTTSQAPPRPLWLLQGPHPLSEPPAAWFSGPERISGGWWDDQRVHRDYYIAQLNSGQLAWVFRDAQGGWFIHGWFG